MAAKVDSTSTLVLDPSVEAVLLCLANMRAAAASEEVLSKGGRNGPAEAGLRLSLEAKWKMDLCGGEARGVGRLKVGEPKDVGDGKASRSADHADGLPRQGTEDVDEDVWGTRTMVGNEESKEWVMLQPSDETGVVTPELGPGEYDLGEEVSEGVRVCGGKDVDGCGGVVGSRDGCESGDSGVRGSSLS